MTKPSNWKQFIQHKLQSARKEDRYRTLRGFDSIQPGWLLQNGQRLLNLCSNDYLGLANDPANQEEGQLLAEVLPAGSGASRLITGNLAIHQELERLLAEWKGTEAALVFPTGFQTNIGVLSALLGKGDHLFADRWNHASLIDGCLLSGAELNRYRHADLQDLRTLLKGKSGSRKMIVTDGVFSMDGDIAPIPDLVKIAKRHGALLLIDDAHATGVLGPNGEGTLAHFRLPWEENIILIGTLSKAIGAQGGYVCASRAIIDYLINYCRSFIYSTGISPWVAGMAHVNICRIRSDETLRTRLRIAIDTMRSALRDEGIAMEEIPTPILPVLLGESSQAVHCAEMMLEHQIVAAAIRPPTVPEGTARIRLSVSAAHDPEDLRQAAHTLGTILQLRKEMK